jgi:hypothetical protein
VLWRENMTIWDLKGPTKALFHELTAAVCAGRVQLQGSALVPGCGSGYDVKALAAAGMKRVVGLDIAEEALVAARAEVGSTPNAELICGDFFTEARLAAGSFSFIFDYTFLCAIPPSARAAWGRRTAELLAPTGRLLTLAFPLASDEVSHTVVSCCCCCSSCCSPAHAPPAALTPPLHITHWRRWPLTLPPLALPTQFPLQSTGRPLSPTASSWSQAPMSALTASGKTSR